MWFTHSSCAVHNWCQNYLYCYTLLISLTDLVQHLMNLKIEEKHSTHHQLVSSPYTHTNADHFHYLIDLLIVFSVQSMNSSVHKMLKTGKWSMQFPIAQVVLFCPWLIKTQRYSVCSQSRGQIRHYSYFTYLIYISL